MTPGTRVSDGILTGAVQRVQFDQVLVTLDAGATVWLSRHTLRPIAPGPKPKTFDEVVAGALPNCGGPRASDTCSVIGCDDIALCKGMCNRHYKQASYRKRKGQEEDGWN